MPLFFRFKFALCLRALTVGALVGSGVARGSSRWSGFGSLVVGRWKPCHEAPLSLLRQLKRRDGNIIGN